MSSQSELLRKLLARRYGRITDLPEIAEIPELLLSHRSVRKYLDRPLGNGVIESLIASAQSASTSSNLQAWSVISVEDPARKAQLAELASNQNHIRDAPLQLVWVADLARLYNAAAEQGIDANGVNYLELFLIAVVDAALAAQNAFLAAESMGLGAVYIGAMRNHPEAVAELLNLPDRCFAVFGMCVGHPDPNQPASIKPRLCQEAVWHRETYKAEAIPERVEDYDKTSLAFYRTQNMDRKQWSVHSGNRITGPNTLNGRHALKTYLNRLGFPLF